MLVHHMITSFITVEWRHIRHNALPCALNLLSYGKLWCYRFQKPCWNYSLIDQWWSMVVSEMSILSNDDDFILAYSNTPASHTEASWVCVDSDTNRISAIASQAPRTRMISYLSQCVFWRLHNLFLSSHSIAIVLLGIWMSCILANGIQRLSCDWWW